MPTRTHLLAGRLLPAVLLAASAAVAHAQVAVPARPAIVVPAAALATRPAPAPVVLGLMAFLDPETGLLAGPLSAFTPPADQQAAVATVLLEEFPLPGGGWAMDLKGTGMESYVLTLDAFGAAHVSCVQDARPLLGWPVRRAASGKER